MLRGTGERAADEKTQGGGGAHFCVLLWFCEALGPVAWGCPFRDALLELPSCGFALCLLDAGGSPGTPHPGGLQPGDLATMRHGRRWIQVAVDFNSPLCPSPLWPILVLKTTPYPF